MPLALMAVARERLEVMIVVMAPLKSKCRPIKGNLDGSWRRIVPIHNVIERWPKE
jgi:hypothetical protein